MSKTLFNVEQVNDAETPEEMRAEIFRLEHYDPLVRNVMDSANYNGASAEDRYTVLAYNALKQLCKIKQNVLIDLRCRPLEPFIIPSTEEVKPCKSAKTNTNR
jgi:hypothetical protein